MPLQARIAGRERAPDHAKGIASLWSAYRAGDGLDA